jgi:hypothetical protein
MGYSTDFYGFWTLIPALSLAQTDYLQKFSRTRRVKRNPDAIIDRRLAALGLDLGVNAEYFVDTEDEDESIVDVNLPPGKQPSLWCKWRVNDRGNRLEHTGGEKLDRYVEWLDYIVEHFFSPWGVRIDGSVRYEGEELIDAGTIEIIDNRIEVRPNIYPRICPKGAIYVCERESELEIGYVNVYREIIDDPGNEGAIVTQIGRDRIFRVIHRSQAGMLIYSRSWDSIWLPDNLVERFLLVPDKLAVRCPISIEPIDDPDCRYRLVKCADGNGLEQLYPTNSLWQIDRLLDLDRIIALDPAGNQIEIDRSELNCFVSIEIEIVPSSQLQAALEPAVTAPPIHLPTQSLESKPHPQSPLQAT